MEHMPEIKLAESKFPRVPYLCNEEYDGLFWGEYGERRGWDTKRLLLRDYTEHPPKETASFLQNWLFFGTIDHIIGAGGSIPRATFLVKDEGGSLWITTARLDECIREWAEYVNGIEDDVASVKSFITQIHGCLNDVAIFSDVLYKSENCPLPVEVILSIKVLGYTIESALAWYWDFKTPRKWELKDIAASRMLQTGWCLRDVSMASHYLSEITMFYASYAKRDYQDQDHSQCTERICVVNQIDKKSYRTQHTTKTCRCNHVAPDQEQIRKILRKGQVPVISLTSKKALDGTQTLEVGVKAHASMRWFIAISHVWSDGLGNPNQNSLPLCQVRQLYNLLVNLPWDELYGSLNEAIEEDLLADPDWDDEWKDRIEKARKKVGPVSRSLLNKVRDLRGRPISIWIDTFCVPLENEYKEMAIAGFLTVYSGAMVTVVLDAELQRTSGLCSDQENLLRIATSGWMRRAWTFQEGVLANARLKVKFADTLVDLPKLIEPRILDKRNDGVNFYITHNPKVVSVIERMGKYMDKLAVVTDVKKLPQEDTERREGFSLAAYIMQDTRTFYDDMKKVWFIVKDRNNRKVKLERIIAAWNGLRWRATSHEGDKFIIFATACIMSPEDLEVVKALVHSPDEQRMKMWISQQLYLPEGFLFTKGPRLREPGWRWVPASVHQNALICEAGVDRAPKDTSLRVVKPGFLIFAGGALVGCRAFSFKERQSSQRYRVRIDSEYLLNATGALHADGTLGLVLGKAIGSEYYNKWNEEAGTLIKVISQTESVIIGAFVCTVGVKREESDVSDGPGIVLARSVEADQVWNVT